MHTEGLPFTGNSLQHEALGGSESAFIYVAQKFAERGHRVTAFCICSEEGRFDNVDYLHIDKWNRWCTRNKSDLFICSRFFHDVFLQPIEAGVKVLWCHDLFMPESVAAMQRIINQIDYIYCLSNYHMEETLKLFPHFGNKIRKMSNGVDINTIERIAGTISEKKHKIMYTSRPERGLEEAWEAYKKFNDPDLEFLICFYNNPYVPLEGIYFDEIKAYQERGFKVRFGSFGKEELCRHIAESKLVIYPPNFLEIFCISAVEAQACRTAYLTRPLAALAETVGYTLLTETGADAFHAQMQRILNDNVFRKQLEQQGSEHVKGYTWDAVADRFIRDAENHLSAKFNRSLNQDTIEAESMEQSENNFSIEKSDPDTLPLISCLCVTSNRIILLKQAIQCFIDQAYPKKELIIVGSGKNRFKSALESHLDYLNRDDIHFTWYPEDDNNLGKKRNLSMNLANGEIFCNWDDDDLYHPERLSLQYQHMNRKNADACFLTDFLQFFEKKQELFWVDWSYQDILQKNEQNFHTSMMIKRDDRFHYPEEGPHSIKGEDSAFMNKIFNRIKIAQLPNHGFLYLYRFHKRNMLPYEHHLQVAGFGAREREYIERRQENLWKALEYYRLPMPFFIKERNGQVVSIYNTVSV